TGLPARSSCHGWGPFAHPPVKKWAMPMIDSPRPHLSPRADRRPARPAAHRPRSRLRAAACGVAVAWLAAALPVSAQIAEPTWEAPPIAGTWEPVRSLGQPSRVQGFARLGYGFDRSGAGDE